MEEEVVVKVLGAKVDSPSPEPPTVEGVVNRRGKLVLLTAGMIGTVYEAATAQA